MTLTLAYTVAHLATFAYLAAFGGRTGLWGGSLLLATSLVTQIGTRILADAFAIFAYLIVVDVCSLTWKISLATFSTRRWPIWVAGLQVNLIGAHILATIFDVPPNNFYFTMLDLWSFPTLLAMVIGTWLDNIFERSRKQLDRATCEPSKAPDAPPTPRII